MDKGAHFYRCDLQVHSPRDINWDGGRPVTDDDRDEYARSFIAACREKELDAVAITDHHDTGFFRFIRQAAENERNSDGDLLDELERIAVFPGMELTLGICCQALLILDADYPLEFLPQIATALSIVCNQPSEPQHAAVVRLDHFKDFNQLYERLDELSYVKGRYIVLPNVSSGGKSTLQRQGMLAHYKAMPCVGGYLDHAVDSLGIGDRKILEGKVEAYDFKPLGIFPTSDNRHADFSRLGTHSAWVKWAEPTAEALRQACLARQTRILHEPPELPTQIISELHVSLSKFLGDIDVEFNPQFNCLIGGRGTGKSTLLEYLRWGLCDQEPTYTENQDIPSFQQKRISLIENTLLPYKAVVTVVFVVNGVKHVVRRKTETGEILLKVGEDEFKKVQEEDIRELLPLQAYSQKQLSVLSIRNEELRRFVEAPVRRRLSELTSLRKDASSKVRSTFTLAIRKTQLGVEIARQEIEQASLEKQLSELRKQLKGLSKEEQATLANQEQLSAEAEIFADWSRQVETARATVERAELDLEQLPRQYPKDATHPNKELLTEANDTLKQLFEVAKNHLVHARMALSAESAHHRRFTEILEQWKGLFNTHIKEYEAVKSRATAHESLLHQIAEVEERVKEIRQTIAQRKETFESHGDPETQYEAAREQWEGLFANRASLLEERCEQLTSLSGGLIRATLQRGRGVAKVQDKLTSILEGTGIRTQAKKIEDLCTSVSTSTSSVQKWQDVLSDLKKLAVLDAKENANVAIPDVDSLTAAGFTSGDIEKIATRLTADSWVDLSLEELADVPVFEYRQREDEYIDFADASAGQQATALLRVLLNQKGPPLIIDQPEDDLDNQVILDVVEEIWHAKRRRQLLFSSHNANIVVNGDADLVVCFDYRTTGDQSGGAITDEGAIDKEDIRKQITTIMEGGQDAFRMRKEKYGF